MFYVCGKKCPLSAVKCWSTLWNREEGGKKKALFSDGIKRVASKMYDFQNVEQIGRITLSEGFCCKIRRH